MWTRTSLRGGQLRTISSAWFEHWHHAGGGLLRDDSRQVIHSYTSFSRHCNVMFTTCLALPPSCFVTPYVISHHAWEQDRLCNHRITRDIATRTRIARMAATAPVAKCVSTFTRMTATVTRVARAMAVRICAFHFAFDCVFCVII